MNRADELVAQSWAPLVVLKRSSAKLGRRFRLQFEAPDLKEVTETGVAGAAVERRRLHDRRTGAALTVEHYSV